MPIEHVFDIIKKNKRSIPTNRLFMVKLFQKGRSKMSEKELLELLVRKVSGIETDIAVIKTDVAVLKTDVSGLKTDVSGLKTDVTGLKTEMKEIKTELKDVKDTVNRIEKRQNGIFEQTAGLLEFRTEVVATLREINENQKSISGVLGEHEIQIRNLRRRPV